MKEKRAVTSHADAKRNRAATIAACNAKRRVKKLIVHADTPSARQTRRRKVMKTKQEVDKNFIATIGYGFRRELDMPFDQAVQRTRDALAGEGFGVLCEIDIKAKLKEKLGVDFRNYLILGACNPPLAFEALQEEIDLGLLLPCNVVVYEQDSTVAVGVIDAAKMMSVVGNENLNKTAQTVNDKLRRVIDAL